MSLSSSSIETPNPNGLRPIAEGQCPTLGTGKGTGIQAKGLWHICQTVSAFIWCLPAGLLLSGYATGDGNAPPTLSPWSLGVVELILALAALRLLLVPVRQLRWRHSVWLTLFWAVGTLLLHPFVPWWNRFPETQVFAFSMVVHWIFASCLVTQSNALVGAVGALIGDRELQEEAEVFFRSVWIMFLTMWTLVGIMITMAIMILDESSWYVAASLTLMRIRSYLFVTALVPLSLTIYLLWKAHRSCVAILTSHRRLSDRSAVEQ